MGGVGFGLFLCLRYGADKGFYKCIYPQMKAVIVHTLMSVKVGMENSTDNGYQVRRRGTQAAVAANPTVHRRCRCHDHDSPTPPTP